jgi:hypothetical protein
VQDFQGQIWNLDLESCVHFSSECCTLKSALQPQINMSNVYSPRTPAPHADLAVYRLRIQCKLLSQLFRTLSDQVRPNEDKLRRIVPGGITAEVDAILTEDELSFIKLIYPDLQVDWLHKWDEEIVRLFNGG